MAVITQASESDRDAITARLLHAGNPEGLRRLLRDHGGHVRWLLRRTFHSVLDASEIDDAMNLATVRAWRSPHAYQEGFGNLGAWFFVITRNCARRLLHNKKKAGALTFVEDLDSSAMNHEPQESPDDARRRFTIDLHRCIERLPPQQREVILADLAAGGIADTEELMEVLDTSKNSIYVSRANAKKTLRIEMQKLGHFLDELPAPMDNEPGPPGIDVATSTIQRRKPDQGNGETP
jgi:RNA polymerase sigma factor (sigma-70 family)